MEPTDDRLRFRALAHLLRTFILTCVAFFSSDGRAACPDGPVFPSLQALVKDVQAGFAVNNPSVKVGFPTDDSKQSESARITAALIALQNLNGPGKGCPAASTTLVARQRALSV